MPHSEWILRLPGVTIGCDGDGRPGYAVRFHGDQWVPGQFSIEEAPEAAADEILAAIKTAQNAA